MVPEGIAGFTVHVQVFEKGHHSPYLGTGSKSFSQSIGD